MEKPDEGPAPAAPAHRPPTAEAAAPAPLGAIIDGNSDSLSDRGALMLGGVVVVVVVLD